VESLAEWLAILGGMTVFILMTMVTIDAIGRKTFGSLPGALEFSEAIMVPIVFLPLMFVQTKREHVFVSVVTAGLPIRWQCFLDALAALTGAVIFGFLTWLALIKAIDSTAIGEYRVAVITVPIWPFRWFIPFGTGLMVLQLLSTAREELRRAFGAREPVTAEAELR
jgi:TRAP-type C4-dicarboxylate transport system permease small subunit